MELSPDFPEVLAEYLMKIAEFLLIVFIVLIVHELGHFLAARLFGMNVQSVEIGRGRKLANWQDKKETLWLLRAFPLGAYVHLEGEETEYFQNSPFWQRMFTVLAGPAVNLILPFFLFTGFYLCIGQPAAPPVIVGVQKGFAADKASLQAGDAVLAVDGLDILSVKDIWAQGYDGGARTYIYKIRRGDEVFETEIEPGWANYTDERGIDRSHPRYGILWEHGRFKLKDILNINGTDVSGKPELARKMLVQSFDRPAEIILKGTEDNPAPYKLFPQSALNPDLNTPGHEDFDHVYLGPFRGNFYLRKDAFSQIRDAWFYTVNRIGKIASVPFQIFPIDPYAVKDEYRVFNPETRTANTVYNFIHRFSVASILIGLINLLPLPYLDGGHALIQGIERTIKRALSRKQKARIFMLSFFLIYFSIVVSNMDNIPGYIDSRLKKVHEILNQNSKPQGKD